MKLQVQNSKEKQISLQSITNPQKVKILILAQQKISFQDFYFIKPFANIIKLDLSYNKISSFPNGFTFKSYSFLRILFLHYNKIQKLKIISVLSQSNSIIYLTLFGNPLEETITRHFCVNTIKALLLMDDKIVGQEQKFQGVLNISDLKRNVGFPLVDPIQENSSIQFLGNVLKEISLVRKFYVKFNPIVKIQRWVRKIIKNRQSYQNYLNKQIIISAQTNINNRPNHEHISNLEDQIYKTLSNQEQPQLNNKVLKEQKLTKDHASKIYEVLKSWKQFKQFLKLRLRQQKIFATQKWCESNKISYKQCSYAGKQIVTYKVPLQRKSYNKQKQLLKNRLNLIIYNNSNYLLQLKKTKNKQIEQIKTIYEKNRIVQIQETAQNKIKLIYQNLLKRHQSTETFPILFEFSLLRVSASIKIQKLWRGFSQRKKFDALKFFKQNKSAIKIQRWIRNIKFNHRRLFLLNYFQHIKSSDSNYITISLKDFCKLAQPESKNRAINFKLPFSDSKICLKLKIGIQENYQSKNLLNYTQKRQANKDYQIFIRSPLHPFPPHFHKMMQPLVLDQNLQEGDDSNLIINILLKGASKIEKFKIKDKNYSRFYYNSFYQANLRKALIALKTYNFKSKGWLSQPVLSSGRAQVKNVYEQLHQGAFLKMVYDNKNQNMLVNLKFVVKEIQKKSNIQWSPIKARYFQGKTDYSCIILAGSYKTPQLKNNESQIQLKYQSSSPTRRQITHKDNKSLQNNKSQESLHCSYISRNIISLSSQINYQSPVSSRYKNSQIQKKQLCLNSQQSKISLFSDIMTYGKTQPIRQQYSSESELMLMKLKKQLIESQNKEHRYKLQLINEIKNKNNESINSSHKYSQTLNKNIIVQKSNSLLLQKIKKVQKIKDLQKDKLSARYKEKFQLSFLKNGNTSIRNKMKVFQKQRANSSKYQQQKQKYKSEWGKSQVSHSMKKNKHYLSQRRQVLKTQIKQFSIQFSQGDLNLSQQQVQNYQFEQLLNHKQVQNAKRQSQNLIQITRIQQQNVEIINRRQNQQERVKRQNKKKRVVHSVFPQQFYPLKQSKQLGFHLPKLQRRY